MTLEEEGKRKGKGEGDRQGELREKKRERNIYGLVAFHTPLTRDETRNLGLCPDQDPSWRSLVHGTAL